MPTKSKRSKTRKVAKRSAKRVAKRRVTKTKRSRK
jgi:hypothetical protein